MWGLPAELFAAGQAGGGTVGRTGAASTGAAERPAPSTTAMEPTRTLPTTATGAALPASTTARSAPLISAYPDVPLPGEPPRLERLRIVTWNVLVDTEAPGVHRAGERFEALCDVLRGTEADVLCLQEMRKHFFDVLMSKPWVAERFPYTSNLQGAGGGGHSGRGRDWCPHLLPAGLMILSRLPLESCAYVARQPHMSYKGGLVACLDAGGGEEVAIVSLHLEHMGGIYGGAAARRKTLATILRHVHGFDHAFVLGDFNFGDDGDAEGMEGTHCKEATRGGGGAGGGGGGGGGSGGGVGKWQPENDFVRQSGFEDAWWVGWRGKEGDPGDPGYTYDPATCPMAFDDWGRCRLDKCLFRSKDMAWAASDATMIGTDPIDMDLFPSDHFGLCVDFRHHGAARDGGGGAGEAKE